MDEIDGGMDVPAPQLRAAQIVVVVVDVGAVYIEAIRHLLDQEAGLEIVAQAFSAKETIAKVARLHPDLVLTDVDMPGMGGLDLVRQLKNGARPPRVIVISSFPGYEKYARRIGADGFVTKDEIGGVLRPLVHDLFAARRK